MCCPAVIALLIGPRAAILIWWLLDQARWQAAFDTFLIPLLGFFLLPWTTLAYVLVFRGGVEGFDFIWLIVAVLVDLGAYSGGYRSRQKMGNG
ncbi:hypothetical protein DEALK_09610 [Dehalogenimonas alkenigignens]|uniref:Uncharacterized protein n=1 Tax=Dehalogenimonas alkenigignens TaxID=1217799 RepID=A0A0W0GHU3_9CHLR|nr:hypothetical protein [Dehalogenimonas alkenigignens]KTB48116.1 hypothetical protein DEALK_09610 [Dehalogenimonas alkenigignens]